MSGSRQNSLQQQIDNTPVDGILQLIPGEYVGPIAITKAIALVGNQATIWALEGPVLTIDANVSLQGIRVEVTGEYSSEAASVNETAIAVSEAKTVVFADVSVRGNVIGVPAEAGIWRYPRSINLGILKSRCSHTFLLTIIVPIDCRLDCSGISGLHADPIDLTTGLNTIKLRLDATMSHAMIYGNICLKTDLLHRHITITASIADTGAVMDGPTAWQPADLNQLNELTVSEQLPKNMDPPGEFPARLLEEPAISQAVTLPMRVIPINPHDNKDQQTAETDLQLNNKLGKSSSYFIDSSKQQHPDEENPSVSVEPKHSTSRRITNNSIKLPDCFSHQATANATTTGSAEHSGHSDTIYDAPKPILPSNPGSDGLSSPQTPVPPPAHANHKINSTVGKVFGQANTKDSAPVSSSQSSPEVTDNEKSTHKASKRIKGNNFINPNLWTGK